MKTKNAIKTASVETLASLANEHGLQVSEGAKKADLVSAVTLHFFPPAPAEEKKDDASESKVDALKLSTSAKKATTPAGRMASTFQACKALFDAKESVSGILISAWKSNPKRGDYDGLTIRFSASEETVTGIDKAILSNLKKAIASTGLVLSTMTIRPSGSVCMWAK